MGGHHEGMSLVRRALGFVVLAGVSCRSAAAMDAADAGSAAEGYASADAGACTPGVPRCHGEYGYQTCEQDGTWSASHSCAGYSENGTSSYCVTTKDPSGQPWAACVDPACWYWITKGFIPGNAQVGICEPDGTIEQCSPGGTLARAPCHGVCTQVDTLDGRALGYCSPECIEGARECTDASAYRTCQDGRWQNPPSACAVGTLCNPTSTGELPDIRCGTSCDPQTSRCSADFTSIEICDDTGAWKLDHTCMLGRCRSRGPQAECEIPSHLCADVGP
jgi:hypothetical protein